MTGSINKGHHYYKCSNARGKCNGNGYIREDKLGTEFARILNKIKLAKEDCDAIASAISDFKATEIRDRDHEIERLQKQAARFRTKMDASYEDHLDGKIDQDMWQRAHARHSEQ